jgi:hypothetical protein
MEKGGTDLMAAISGATSSTLTITILPLLMLQIIL